jgi:hypothetical protein
LIPADVDAADLIYHKLEGLARLTVSVFQNQRGITTENDSFQDTLMSSMTIIDRIPYLRSFIVLSVLSLLNAEVDRFAKHRESGLTSEPYISKLTTYAEGVTRPLSLNEIVMFTLNTIHQMQEIANKSLFSRVAKKREMILCLESQPVLCQLAKMIGGINLSQSIV